MGPNDSEILTAISADQRAPHIVIEPSIKAPDGSFLVYDNGTYREVVGAWEVEQHIPPINARQTLGDIESWVAYVTRFTCQVGQFAPLLTWSAAGILAIMDYHGADGTPGRCKWQAFQPFEETDQLRAWQALADGRPRTQRQAVEALDDLAEDISEPDAATILNLLRTLRATVTAEASSELQQDGGSRASWTKNRTIQAGALTIPPEIKIGIPLLKGHVTTEDETVEATDDQGKSTTKVIKAGSPIPYILAVKIRPDIGDDARLTFRFSMPTAERVLETVYADRVAAAKALLGEGYTLLRAAS